MPKKIKKRQYSFKRMLKKLLRIVMNWHLWLCVGIAWLLTNGWSYILLGIGTFLEIEWMIAVAGAYLAFLWLPFTPEKIVTVVLAILLLKVMFPRDEKTLAVLIALHRRTRKRHENHKKRRRQSAPSDETLPENEQIPVERKEDREC